MYRFYMVTLFSFMFMTGGTAVAHNIRLPEKIEQLELTRIADNTYAVHGLLALPDNGLNGGEKLQIDGLEIKTHHTGHAHTDSDIMVEFPKQKVLFTGDILEHRRAVSVDVPEDFRAVGQIDTIRYALELPVDTYVPVYPATA